MAKITWHIEPTSKCILECPLCDRTWFYKKFKKRLTHDIDIDHLINFLKGSSPEVLMCGNNGDPIYHNKFHELCSGLKNIDSKITITTNGSGKKKDWWEKLCSILTENDSIEFSIDGLEDTNHLYRKNAKWKTIMDAIEVVTNHNIDTTWKFIVFKHNQHQIEDAKNYSKELGIKNFRLIKSDRWWDTEEELMPNDKYVDQIYHEQIKVTSGKDMKVAIRQQCMSKQDGEPDTELYIDSSGDFYPCCKIGTYAFRYNSIFTPKNKKFNIKDISIQKLLGNSEIKNFFDSTKDYDSAHKCCKIYCRSNQSKDRKIQENVV